MGVRHHHRPPSILSAKYVLEHRAGGSRIVDAQPPAPRAAISAGHIAWNEQEDGRGAPPQPRRRVRRRGTKIAQRLQAAQAAELVLCPPKYRPTQLVKILLASPGEAGRRVALLAQHEVAPPARRASDELVPQRPEIGLIPIE